MLMWKYFLQGSFLPPLGSFILFLFS